MDDVQLVTRLERIDARLESIEAIATASSKATVTLADRVGTQNHRLDKVEWQQEMARVAAVEKDKADERTWANARWMTGWAFMAAGVTSGIVFGLISVL